MKMTSNVIHLTFWAIIAFSFVQTDAFPIISSLSKLGNTIKNNEALDALALQIVPMTTRIKMATFVSNAYKNMDLENTIKTNMQKVGTFLQDEVLPVAKDAVHSLNEKISPYLRGETEKKIKPKVDKDDQTEFYEYLTN